MKKNMKKSDTPRFYPMLFSTLMVKALLAGTKTQTRRLVKPQPIIDPDSGFVYDGNHKSFYKNDANHLDWRIAFIQDHAHLKVGDIIWVRETFMEYWTDDVENLQIDYKADSNNPPLLLHDDDGFQVYNSDGSERYIAWKPSLFMPKKACRLWLKVTNVRIEALQEISEEDAIKEGIIFEWINLTTQTFTALDYRTNNMRFDFTAKDSYKSLWDKINGIDDWAKNSFVWVYDFEVLHECPDGFIE